MPVAAAADCAGGGAVGAGGGGRVGAGGTGEAVGVAEGGTAVAVAAGVAVAAAVGVKTGVGDVVGDGDGFDGAGFPGRTPPAQAAVRSRAVRRTANGARRSEDEDWAMAAVYFPLSSASAVPMTMKGAKGVRSFQPFTRRTSTRTSDAAAATRLVRNRPYMARGNPVMAPR